MPEDQLPSPQEQPSDQESRDRFRRLMESEENDLMDDDQDDALADTQPSQAIPVEPAAGPEDTSPSEPLRAESADADKADSEDVEPDEAETIAPPSGISPFTPAPPPLGHTPPTAPPAMDTSGMPLPRRVTERDPEATRVTRAAYSGATNAPGGSGGNSKHGGNGNWRDRFRRWFGGTSSLWRFLIVVVFAGVGLAALGSAFALYQYYSIASTLPSVEGLRDRASQFETTRILDAEGNLLYEILDPTAGRRTYVQLENISPYLVAATIATEDKAFYSNPGFSPDAILRAFYQNYSSGEVVSGASTITQQLAKTLLFTPEEAAEQSYLRKVREAILAAEITRRYSKDEILELYLNEIYYGNLAYGIEAAAQTYFGTTAGALDLEQASFLAGLPQSPSVYDIYNNPEATLDRQQDVLRLMYQLSAETNCIEVSNSPQRVCVNLDEATAAALNMLDYEFNSPDVQIRYPHWVHYIRSLLEAQYDPQTIYRSGFTVYTTLVPGLQDLAQDTVRENVELLADRNVGSGALVALRPSDGAILAMVGSADFYNEENDGQINMAVSPRQPGSSIKPLTYAAAFEKGWTPATLIWDVESEFPPSGNPDDPREPYIPENYDERFHGPVTVRTALANSYNVPAVKTLDFVGIYDDPDTTEQEGLVAFAHRMGITDLEGDQYGLSLTLGGGEVQLLDLTSAYGVFANGGQRVEPMAITRIVDHEGEVVYEAPEPSGAQVLSPQHAYLITSILSDNQARTPSFGSNSLLNLPFPAAAKTGTTDDFRDNWTMGFTPDLAVGVWVGNPDFTEMQGTSGLSGAAPIWNEFMQEAVEYLFEGVSRPFTRPPGIQEQVICTVSGAEPSSFCPSQRTEIFAEGQPPEPSTEDLWQERDVDTWTGKRASAACSGFSDERFGINVSDPWAIKWLTETSQGRDWAEDYGFDQDPLFFMPTEECDEDDPRPILALNSPADGSSLGSSPIPLSIQANATAYYDRVVVEVAYGSDPDDWDWLEIYSSDDPVLAPTTVLNWDFSDLDNNELTVRLRIYSTIDTYAEIIHTVQINLPTPTPLPTSPPTITPTPSITPTPTNTSAPTSTSTDTPPPSNTPVPTATVPSPTPTP